MYYLINLSQALTRLWNALRGNPWYMSTCATEYEKKLAGKDNLVEFIDKSFKEVGHCKRAYDISQEIKAIYERKGNEQPTQEYPNLGY